MKYIWISVIVVVFAGSVGLHQLGQAQPATEPQTSKVGVVHNIAVEGMNGRAVDPVIMALPEIAPVQFRQLAEGLPEPIIGSEVAFVKDLESGQILYQKNIYDRHQLASITKLLTVATIMDEYTLGDSEWVSMTELPLSTYGSNGFLAGESYRVEDLIKGLLLPSNNIAAAQLAEHFGKGDIEYFMGKMNQKAQMIGMNQSRFVNPHGLDQEGQYSTAADIMALLEHMHTQYPELWEIMRQEELIVQSQSGKELTLRNSNELVGELANLEGGKTGFTFDALETLASVVTIQDRPVGIVVLQGPIGGFRFSDTIALNDWVTTNYALPL